MRPYTSKYSMRHATGKYLLRRTVRHSFWLAAGITVALNLPNGALNQDSGNDYSSAYSYGAHSHGQAQHGQAQAASLSTELRLMLMTHPELKAAAKRVDIADQAVREAQSSFFPEITVSGEVGPNTVSTPGGRTNETVEELDGRVGSLEARQMLLDWGATWNAVDASKMEADAARIGLNLARQEALFTASRAYMEVMRNRELISVNNRREESIRTQTRLEDERVRSGAGVSIDVLQAKKRLQRAINERLGTKRRLERASAAYNKIFGIPVEAGPLEDDVTNQLLIPATMEQALEIARANAPDYLRALLAADTAKERINEAWADFLPTLELVGSIDYSENDGSRGITRDTRGYLEMNWDLFSGFGTVAAVERLTGTWGEALSQSDVQRLNVDENVRAAWGKLENARERQDLYRNGQTLAEELLIARQKLRDSGKETALGVLDAEIEVFQSEVDLINANYDARAAAVELVRSTGILTPASLGIVLTDEDLSRSDAEEMESVLPEAVPTVSADQEQEAMMGDEGSDMSMTQEQAQDDAEPYSSRSELESMLELSPDSPFAPTGSDGV